MKPKDKYEEFSCEFKNEAEWEEELDEQGLDASEIERRHYNEEAED